MTQLADIGKVAHICILTPSPIGSNPRLVKEADALHEAGYRVTVIATRMLDRVEPRDQSLIARIGWQLERIDLSNRWRWRAYRAAQLVCRRGYAASGLERMADAGMSAFTLAITIPALRTAADLYIAHYPAALPAAAAAARRYGTSYAYDAEDFHLGDWPDDPAYEIERQLVRSIERRYLPNAAFVTAASPGIADAYAETYGIARPIEVLNVFPLVQAPSEWTARGSALPGPSVYWFSQTIGPDRGLESAIRAVGLAETRPHLYLRGSPAAGYIAELELLASQVGSADRLHVIPPAAPDDMERLAAAYDIGLVSETGKTRNRRICLTNKLFSFVLAGVPPLMSKTDAHTTFMARTGLNDLDYPIDDAVAMARRIDSLLGDPERLAAARAEAWRLGQERYNWDLEKSKVTTAVAITLAARATTLRQGAEAAQ